MRAFLAIEPSDALRARIDEAARALSLGGMKRTPASLLHLTLRFLGDIADPAVIVRAVEPVCARHRAFALPVAGGGAFGAHVAWVGVRDDGRLAALADDVERALVSAGAPAADKPFAAHITIARAKKRVRLDASALAGVGALGALAVDDVVLFESALTASGVAYTPRARMPLAR